MINKALAIGIAMCLSLGVQAAEKTDAEKQKIASALLEKGVAAYVAGDAKAAADYYSQSLRNWKTPLAANNLCNLYLYGNGVPRNYDTAFKLCDYAAKHNNTNAMVMLGEMYFMGNGIQQDKQKALTYFKHAAELGHVHAQFIAGTLLIESTSATDRDKAINWLEKTKHQGYPEAQSYLDKVQAGKDPRSRTTE